MLAGLVALHAIEKHLERLAVEDVLARMHFEAAVLAVRLEDVEDRFPALRELVETRLRSNPADAAATDIDRARQARRETRRRS
jgi:hypothetical protein